jgi:Tfp pilus assembly protein PilZ
MAEPRRRPSDREKRRTGGALRVPFVRRCQLDYEGGATAEGFIVNINSLGAYISQETIPETGRRVVLRFHVPGNEREVTIDGLVAWTNPLQEHPVHSLPPGFGLAFRSVGEEAAMRIEDVVSDYLARHASDDD